MSDRPACDPRPLLRPGDEVVIVPHGKYTEVFRREEDGSVGPLLKTFSGPLHVLAGEAVSGVRGAGALMPQPAQQRRVAAAGAAAAAGTAAAGGTVVVAPVGVAGAGGVAASVAMAGIMATFLQFLAALREQHRTVLTRELGRYSNVRDDIAETVRLEMALEQEFAKRAADRVASALPQILRIADPKEREAKLRQLLADEERFARQRGEAMFARAVAALTRFELRRTSPLGAAWRLGHAHNHTDGCVFMAGGREAGSVRFWPWAVLDRVHPPRHYGCLVDGTRVWGPAVKSAMSRWYEGQIIRVAFRSGCEVGITPNHPVLKRSGWVAADALRVGDEVVCCSAEELRMRVGDPDEVQVPAAIEDVAGALADAGDVQAVRVPVAAKDFHGDGREGYVDVVRAGGLLDGRLVVADAQQPGEFAFGFADSPPALLTCYSAAGESVVAVRFASFGSVRGAGLGEALLAREPAFAELGGVAAATERDVRLAEAAEDRGRRDTDRPADGFGAFADEVATDEIVGIEWVIGWRGHVHNLETREGWYSAGGIVVHNCTSSLHSYGEAILAGWMTPSDVPDVRQAVRDAAGVVMEQDEADAVLAELDVRDQLLEMGIDTSAIPFEGLRELYRPDEPRDRRGRWSRIAAALKAGKPARIEAKDAGELVDELAGEEPSSLHQLEVAGHPNLFRAHARELSRAEMPQIPGEHMAGFMEFLRSKRVAASVERVAPASLRATQNQVNGAASAKLAQLEDPMIGRLIMVSREGDVLDGHHRWAGASLRQLSSPGYKVDVLKFSASTDRMLRLMHEYNKLKAVPKRAFGEGPKEIKAA